MITVSVISHGHDADAIKLIQRLLTYSLVERILLTLNIPSQELFPRDSRVVILRNEVPRGFAENHNCNFLNCESEFFCVLNPDLVLDDDPFPYLIEKISTTGAAIMAPRVVSGEGAIENSVRDFPRLSSLFLKAFGKQVGVHYLSTDEQCLETDWVAGMFMLFRAADFSALGGFDEGYFLYYEDVDICARMWSQQKKVLACPGVTVVHNAQRSSHRSLRYFRYHLASLLRYFWKHWGRLPRHSAG